MFMCTMQLQRKLGACSLPFQEIINTQLSRVCDICNVPVDNFVKLYPGNFGRM